SQEPVLRVPVVVGPMECVSVLVTAFGFVRPAALRLMSTAAGPELELSSQTPTGLVGHLQWCDVAGGTFQLQVRLQSHDANDREPYITGTARYEVLRAPWSSIGGPAGLNRGSPSSVMLRLQAGVGESRAFSMAAYVVPPNATPSGPPLRIPENAARIVPTDMRLFLLLQTTAARYTHAMVYPRIDAADVQALGLSTLAMYEPVIDVGFNEFRRVLAVVDFTSVSAQCVTLLFRRGVAVFPPAIQRAPGAVPVAGTLATRENAAWDRWCPGQGSVLYLVPDTDAAAYQLQLYTDGVAP
ncbi:MAG: hypothetical protein WCJ30_22660, partial [Deltaproteobacteria bacterium]